MIPNDFAMVILQSASGLPFTFAFVVYTVF